MSTGGNPLALLSIVRPDFSCSFRLFSYAGNSSLVAADWKVHVPPALGNSLLPSAPRVATLNKPNNPIATRTY